MLSLQYPDAEPFSSWKNFNIWFLSFRSSFSLFDLSVLLLDVLVVSCNAIAPAIVLVKAGCDRAVVGIVDMLI